MCSLAVDVVVMAATTDGDSWRVIFGRICGLTLSRFVWWGENKFLVLFTF